MIMSRCLKQNKQKNTLIENRRADELYIVDQTMQMSKSNAKHHELFNSYIEHWKNAEKDYELEKLKDINDIVKAERKSIVWKECSEIFGQLFELTWKVCCDVKKSDLD